MRVRALIVVLIAAAAALGARQRPADHVPTFNRDIAPILQQNCQACHRAGGMAPFALETYSQASSTSHLISLATTSRRMPPWKPVAGCGDFHGERRLSDQQIETINRWIRTGKREGDPRDLPATPLQPAGWKLGAPDLVLSPADVYVPPQSGDSFQCFVIPRDDREELLISAIDFAPLARENVHHVLAYVDPTGASKEFDRADPDPGYSCMGGPRFTPSAVLGGWFPGSDPFIAPAGVATRVAPGQTIVMQVHYHAHAGHDHTHADKTELAIYLARDEVRQTLDYLAAENVDFVIPAGAPNHQVTASVTLPWDVDIHAIGAHMHLLGKTFEVFATLPDGSIRCLLRIDDWDPAWQGMYQYVEPVMLPAGAMLTSIGTYDNSENNPRNPHYPPRDVAWGEEAFNEMLSGYLAYTRRDATSLGKSSQRTLFRASGLAVNSGASRSLNVD